MDGRFAGERLAALVLLVVSFFWVVSVAGPLPARAASGEAQQLLNLINQERSATGAQPLTFRDDLVQIAAEHSAWMASTGVFQHRSDLSQGMTGPWSRIGENIAYGWSVSNIHRMFMESEGHCRNNLYSGFNRVGIEFATGGSGAMYVTVVFVQESGGSLPAPTVCPYDYNSTTTTAPPATTTTVPPATTTTTAPPATTTTTAPPATTTTAPPATTTTAPPATTTTTAPPATTTTAPPATTMTTAPPATTTTTAATEVVLPLSATTTTESAPAPGDLPTGEPSAPPSAGPIGEVAASASNGDDTNVLPVAPVAGGVAFVGSCGAWWLVRAKRATINAAAASRRAIPHGGVRLPQ